jgi:tryptophan synthase alpha chain
LIPFVTGGFPEPGATLEILETLAEGGADVIEVGIPFSDPVADGPTIQAASQQALRAGTRLATILDTLARWEPPHPPVVLMSYVNPILAYGYEAFFREARAAGVDGLLVSDLPPEERPEFWGALSDSGLAGVVLVAPTTPERRLPSVLSRAEGFVYCLTRTGVTGAGGAFARDLGRRTEAIRRLVELPIAAGFGIRSPEDVAWVRPHVDGVVLGARLLELLQEAPGLREGCRRVRDFLRGLQAALRKEED